MEEEEDGGIRKPVGREGWGGKGTGWEGEGWWRDGSTGRRGTITGEGDEASGRLRRAEGTGRKRWLSGKSKGEKRRGG